MNSWGTKEPCDLTPEDAFRQGMTLNSYAAMEHGREHNSRIARFRVLLAKHRAASVPQANEPATRGDIALLVAVLYDHHRAYTACLDDMKQADAYAAVLEAMGGVL